MGSLALVLLIGVGGLMLIMLLVKWLNPPLKPDVDEWQKWKDI